MVHGHVTRNGLNASQIIVNQNVSHKQVKGQLNTVLWITTILISKKKYFVIEKFLFTYLFEKIYLELFCQLNFRKFQQ